MTLWQYWDYGNIEIIAILQNDNMMKWQNYDKITIWQYDIVTILQDGNMAILQMELWQYDNITIWG